MNLAILISIATSFAHADIELRPEGSYVIQKRSIGFYCTTAANRMQLNGIPEPEIEIARLAKIDNEEMLNTEIKKFAMSISHEKTLRSCLKSIR